MPTLPTPILVAGLDARSLLLEAPVLQRDQDLIVQEEWGRDLLPRLAQTRARLVVLGPRLPDLARPRPRVQRQRRRPPAARARPRGAGGAGGGLAVPRLWRRVPLHAPREPGGGGRARGATPAALPLEATAVPRHPLDRAAGG